MHRLDKHNSEMLNLIKYFYSSVMATRFAF